MLDVIIYPQSQTYSDGNNLCVNCALQPVIDPLLIHKCMKGMIDPANVCAK